jgi:hypothetical protein
MKQNTIFISIASYCDSQLSATVQSAIQLAKYPDKLVFGIVEQQDIDKRLPLTADQRKNIRYLGVDPIESRGVCWARAVAMSLYCDEDWFFQIDSHMIFEQDWDEWFVNKAVECQRFSKKPIITGYPKSFSLVDGKPKKIMESGVKAVVVHRTANKEEFSPENYNLSFEGVRLHTSKPVLGFHIAGGCLFADGKFVYEIPYDPQLYFTGEEQAMALRAYTKGWDIVHVADMPIYHLWARTTRVAHWEGNANIERGEKWWVLADNSRKRLAKLVAGEDIGPYSVGTNRTIKDYANFCGLDYTTNSIEEKALRGPWVQVLE